MASSTVDKPNLAPEFWQKLADSCPTGERISGEVVESWFDSIWPVYEAYAEEAMERSRSKRVNHKLRIANWWRRVRPVELENARVRLEALAVARENEALEALADRINSRETTSPAKVRTLRVLRA